MNILLLPWYSLFLCSLSSFSSQFLLYFQNIVPIFNTLYNETLAHNIECAISMHIYECVSVCTVHVYVSHLWYGSMMVLLNDLCMHSIHRHCTHLQFTDGAPPVFIYQSKIIWKLDLSLLGRLWFDWFFVVCVYVRFCGILIYNLIYYILHSFRCASCMLWSDMFKMSEKWSQQWINDI